MSVVSTGTGMEWSRSLLRGQATVDIKEISSVVEGLLSTSGRLIPGRKCTSEVQFTPGTASKNGQAYLRDEDPGIRGGHYTHRSHS